MDGVDITEDVVYRSSATILGDSIGTWSEPHLFILRGIEGASGPTNLIRYAAFDNDVDAQLNRLTPDNTRSNNGLNDNWVSNPDLLGVDANNNPIAFTHTSRQFGNIIRGGTPSTTNYTVEGTGAQATGNPWSRTVNYTGVLGRFFWPGQQRSSTTLDIISGIASSATQEPGLVSGNRIYTVNKVDDEPDIYVRNPSVVSNTFTGDGYYRAIQFIYEDSLDTLVIRSTSATITSAQITNNIFNNGSMLNDEDATISYNSGTTVNGVDTNTINYSGSSNFNSSGLSVSSVRLNGINGQAILRTGDDDFRTGRNRGSSLRRIEYGFISTSATSVYQFRGIANFRVSDGDIQFSDANRQYEFTDGRHGGFATQIIQDGNTISSYDGRGAWALNETIDTYLDRIGTALEDESSQIDSYSLITEGGFRGIRLNFNNNSNYSVNFIRDADITDGANTNLPSVTFPTAEVEPDNSQHTTVTVTPNFRSNLDFSKIGRDTIFRFSDAYEESVQTGNFNNVNSKAEMMTRIVSVLNTRPQMSASLNIENTEITITYDGEITNSEYTNPAAGTPTSGPNGTQGNFIINFGEDSDGNDLYTTLTIQETVGRGAGPSTNPTGITNQFVTVNVGPGDGNSIDLEIIGNHPQSIYTQIANAIEVILPGVYNFEVNIDSLVISTILNSNPQIHQVLTIDDTQDSDGNIINDGNYFDDNPTITPAVAGNVLSVAITRNLGSGSEFRTTTIYADVEPGSTPEQFIDNLVDTQNNYGAAIGAYINKIDDDEFQIQDAGIGDTTFTISTGSSGFTIMEGTFSPGQDIELDNNIQDDRWTRPVNNGRQV